VHQIEEELRRALHLNQNQSQSNSRRSKGSSSVSAATSLPSDVRFNRIGSPPVTSPQNTASNASHASASERMPTASSSSPSINSSTQATGRRRKSRQSKHYSPQHAPHDAVGVTRTAGNGKNTSQSRKSPTESGTVRVDTAAVTTPGSVDDTSPSSAMLAGLSVSSGSPSAVTGVNASGSVGAAARTVTDQRGGKAPRGRGVTKRIVVSSTPGQLLQKPVSDNDTVGASTSHVTPSGQLSDTNKNISVKSASRGRGVIKHTAVSSVPGQLLQKPKSDDHTRDISTGHVAPSGQLSGASNNMNVKSAPVPAADKNLKDPSNEAAAKIVQNDVKLSVKEHEKGCIH